MAKSLPVHRQKRQRLHLVAAVLISAFSIGALATPAIAQARQEASQYYAPRADWSALNGGDLNISTYIYRDRNRNGVYDLGDRPMAWIVVEMTAPDGTNTVRRSNLHGFTNFEMSVEKRDAPISSPGEYDFRAITPPGWEITSGNGVQASRFEVLRGAVGDMVTKNPPSPIGLAPKLRIFGRVAARGGDGSLASAAGSSVSAEGPNGEKIEVGVDGDGTFTVPASTGTWRLTANHAGTTANLKRKVVVRDTPVRLSTLVFGDVVPSPARHQTEIDFEDITTSIIAKIPSGVAGVNWDYLNATEMLLYKGEGYVNSAISGQYIAYNSSGHPVTISSDEGFDFVGAYFGLAWSNAEGEELVIEAWRNGRIVGEEVIRLSTVGPVWFDAEYRDIDKITMTTRHYWQFVTDNMIIRTKSKSL